MLYKVIVCEPPGDAALVIAVTASTSGGLSIAELEGTDVVEGIATKPDVGLVGIVDPQVAVLTTRRPGSAQIRGAEAGTLFRCRSSVSLSATGTH